ncbi:ParA family protein [Sulfurisphaera javensis]|uniref:ParA family protein n=1 Tax=Sulfurisphaera javensis TaxID=2049879 RepID=A0AAT9GMJ0_9CREN
MQTYRISVLGIKGGVGKSTVSLLLSVELASHGYKVLLIDRDITGTLSRILGIKSKGLLSKISSMENEINETYKKIQVGTGSITIFKFGGDNIETEKATKIIIENKDLREKFIQAYKQVLLSDNFNCVIIDNQPLIGFDTEIAKTEREVYESVFKDDVKYRIYITTFPKEILQKSLDYLIEVEGVSRYKGISNPLAFIINKVKEDEVNEAKEFLEYALNYVNDKIKAVHKTLSLGIIIKFDSRLFLKQEMRLSELPSLYEIKKLADRVCKIDLSREIISGDKS